MVMLFRRFLPLAVTSLLPHWVCLALYSPPAMNLLPRASRKLSKFSLAIECLEGQYTAEAVSVPWRSSITTLVA